MNKKLPKTLFVRWEADDEDGYMIAEENWEEHCELGKKQTVGTYQLIETSDVVSDSRKLPRKR